MTPQEALELCKLAVIRKGFTPSAGCWCDGNRAYAFSVESWGGNCFGACKCAVEAKLVDGVWNLFFENSPLTVEG